MRRDRWLQAALCVTAGTVLLTTGVCGVLSRWLAVPDPDGAPGSAVQASAASHASLPAPPADHAGVILGRSLFDSTPRSGGGGGGVRSVDAMLILTAVADDPVYSTALIVEGGGADPALYAEGDDLDGATVERIERTRVTVRLPGGDRETIRFGDPTPRKLVPVAAGTEGRDLRDGITRLDETHFTVERQTLEDALARLDVLAKDASVVPNFADGQAAGYRLTRVRARGVFAALGLRKNDVLTGVNGLAVDPVTLIEAMDDLKQADQILLEIQRNGTPLVVQYEIR